MNKLENLNSKKLDKILKDLDGGILKNHIGMWILFYDDLYYLFEGFEEANNFALDLFGDNSGYIIRQIEKKIKLSKCVVG